MIVVLGMEGQGSVPGRRRPQSNDLMKKELHSTRVCEAPYTLYLQRANDAR